MSKIRHLAIKTKDPSKLAKFYGDVFDMKVLYTEKSGAIYMSDGYLTLAMLPMLLAEVVSVSDAVMGVNYGTEKIRFTSPVPVGSRVRAHAKLLKTQRRGPSVIWNVGVNVEIEGKEKPALVGEVVYMVAGAPGA